MDFAYSDKVRALQAKLERFMEVQVYPNERSFHEEVEANRAKGNPWVPTGLIEELKPKARAEGLWNLFLPRSPRAFGFSSSISFVGTQGLPFARFASTSSWNRPSFG